MNSLSFTFSQTPVTPDLRLQRPFLLQLRQVLGHGLQAKLLHGDSGAFHAETVEKPGGTLGKTGENAGKTGENSGKNLGKASKKNEKTRAAPPKHLGLTGLTNSSTRHDLPEPKIQWLKTCP